LRDAWVVMASPPLYPYPQTTFVTAGPDGALQLVAAARTGRGRAQRPRRGAARAWALGHMGDWALRHGRWGAPGPGPPFVGGGAGDELDVGWL
jgi:hypothetical protein